MEKSVFTVLKTASLHLAHHGEDRTANKQVKPLMCTTLFRSFLLSKVISFLNKLRAQQLHGPFYHLILTPGVSSRLLH